ncbi:MAG: universal stress protein [Thermodesulfobacteriota bacterium]
MGTKILVALDDSENAMRAVEFIAKNFTPDHEITLFSVLMDTPAICDLQSPEFTPYFISQQKALCALTDRKRDLLASGQEKARTLLRDAGFPDGAISAKIQARKRGVARDIIDEARTGYQIVVLGRRGLSSIGEFLLGSVSQKVLHACKDVTILLVS